MANELVPFNFHGDMLDVVKSEGKLWVSVRRVCEGLGLNYSRQWKKLKDKINYPWAVVALKETTAADGKNYETFVIDVDCADNNAQPARSRQKHLTSKLVFVIL